MKLKTTLFLKIAVIFIGILVLTLGIFVLFDLYKYPLNPNNHELMLYPIIIDIYVTVIPFYIALYQTFKLLCYIDKSIAFSELSVKALKNIKCCAITISGLYVLGLLLFRFIAKEVDPPIGLMGFIIIFASAVIAIFAAVLQKLLEEVIEIKSENDLTV